jgi:hypothetical protein
MLRTVPAEIAMVASGERWPYNYLQATPTISHPNVAKNVVGGVGFVGGVLTKFFPYSPEACSLTLPGDYCDITFNAESVTVGGTVVDRCRLLPIAEATVALHEVTGNRIRSTVTDGEGRYQIRGLESELDYRLSIIRTQFLNYQEGTLIFDAAEDRNLPRIEMEWEPNLDPCQFI